MDLICNVCNSKKISQFKKINRFTLLKCRSCNIIQSFPQLSEFEINKLNDNFYGKQSKKTSDYYSSACFFCKRAEHLINRIKKLQISGRRLLDIGSGYGYNQLLAENNGFKTTGIDFSESASEFSKRIFNLNIIHGDFRKHNFEKDSFDVVTMYDSLEHLKDPQLSLKQVNKILIKNGYVVIQCPNIDSVMFKLTQANWFWLLLPFHFYHFTPISITKILNNSGFSIIKIETIDDRREFIRNLLWLFKIREDGKLRYLFKPLYLILNILFPISFIWNIFKKGALIRVYAQKA